MAHACSNSSYSRCSNKAIQGAAMKASLGAVMKALSVFLDTSRTIE